MTFTKSILCALLAAVCLSVAVSCSDKEHDIPCEYIAVQGEKGWWSFYSSDGELKFKDKFLNQPSDVYDGYFFVQKGNGYTLYKFGKELEPVAGRLSQVGFMGDGLVPVVRKKERITLLDGEGNVKFVLEPVNGEEIVRCHPRYSEGLLAVAIGKGDGTPKWGYVDTDGKAAIAPEYAQAADFHDGVAIVRFCGEDNPFGAEYAFIDKEGNVIKKFAPDTRPMGNRFISGRLVVRDKDNRFSVIGKNGETVERLPGNVTDVAGWDGDCIVFSKDEYRIPSGYDNYGVMDYEGKTVIEPRYSRLQITGPGRFLGSEKRSDGKMWVVVMDKNGKAGMQTGSYPYGALWAGQFGIAGLGRDAIKFIGDNGKVRTDATFLQIGGLEPEVLNSEYNIANEAIAYVAGLVNDRGVGKYGLGITPAMCFTDPYVKDYRLSPVASLDSLETRGDNFRVSALGSFTGRIARSTKGDADGGVCTWNPDSRLYKVNVVIHSDSWTAKDSEALAEAVARKGFKIEAATRSGVKWYCALLTKGRVAVIIAKSGYGNMGPCITVCQNSEETRRELSEAIARYNQDPGTTGLSLNVRYDPAVPFPDTAGEK